MFSYLVQENKPMKVTWPKPVPCIIYETRKKTHLILVWLKYTLNINSKSEYFSPNTNVTPANTWLWKCSTCLPKNENVVFPGSVRKINRPRISCKTIPHITGLQSICKLRSHVISCKTIPHITVICKLRSHVISCKTIPHITGLQSICKLRSHVISCKTIPHITGLQFICKLRSRVISCKTIPHITGLQFICKLRSHVIS
jgi:acetoacetate decarboxylase